MFQDELNLIWLDRLDNMSTLEIREKLKQTCSFFLSILEMGNEGILVLGKEFDVEYANQTAAELIGVPKERLLGMQFPVFMRDSDRDMWTDMHRTLVQTCRGEARKLCTEIVMTTTDGWSRNLEVCLSIAPTEDGYRTFAYLHDLTQRVEMQNKLRKTNTFLTNLIKSSVHGILSADTKGNVLIFNEGAERMLGYRAEEVVGKIPITEVYGTPEQAKSIMQKLRSEDHGGPGKLTSTQVNLKDKEGRSIPCNLSAALIFEDGQEVATVGVFTDLRERIEMERQLENTHLQLVQSEKMASLGKLAAGVAHEINNPLGGILMYANILREDLEPDDPKLEDLQRIIDQTLRCKVIVQDLLDFSRQSGSERTGFSLNGTIHKVMALFKNQSMFHNIRIVTDLDPDLPTVEGDPGLMNQVISNLMVNAADAMGGEGVLRIRSYQDKERNRIVVEVADTGCGIPEEHLSSIFDPFFTTKKVGEGTGLGLSTAYGIVRKHGGDLTVESEVGKGTLFRIELPVPREEQMPVR